VGNYFLYVSPPVVESDTIRYSFTAAGFSPRGSDPYARTAIYRRRNNTDYGTHKLVSKAYKAIKKDSNNKRDNNNKKRSNSSAQLVSVISLIWLRVSTSEGHFSDQKDKIHKRDCFQLYEVLNRDFSFTGRQNTRSCDNYTRKC